MDEGIVFTGDEFVRPEEASFSIFDAGLAEGLVPAHIAQGF